MLSSYPVDCSLFTFLQLWIAEPELMPLLLLAACCHQMIVTFELF